MYKLVLTGLLISFNIWAASNCTYSNSNKEEIAMPPLRSQDSTGFCYAFAATALIQHKFCKSKPTGCKYPEDQLSELDIIAQGNYGNGGLIHGGGSFDVLQKVAYNKKVSSDSCAPFDQFLNSEKIWKSIVISSKEKFDQCKSQEIAENLKAQLNLKANAAQIYQALGYRDFSIMMSKLFIPEECQKNKVSIPDYKPEKIEVKDFIAYKNKISEILTQKKPVIANICAATLPPSQPTCAGYLHALVIDGIRQKCCQAVCETEYHIHDSAKPGTFSKNEISDDDWISEKILKNRFESFIKTPGTGASLIWIE